jgi:hypothetical protein
VPPIIIIIIIVIIIIIIIIIISSSSSIVIIHAVKPVKTKLKLWNYWQHKTNILLIKTLLQLWGQCVRGVMMS